MPRPHPARIPSHRARLRATLPLVLLVACGSPASPRPPASAPTSAPSAIAVALPIDAGLADASPAPPADPIVAEADRRHQALLEQGFNMTQGFGFDPKKTNQVRLDLVIPPPGGEHAFRFWADVGTGTVAVHLRGPDGAAVAAWSGHRGELSFDLNAAAGSYVLEIDRPQGVTGRALFGVRGQVLASCSVPAGGTVREIAKADTKEFHWPYLLYVPKEVHGRRLLVLPNNTGFSTDDVALLHLSGSCDVAREASMADRLGVPVLVPLFPRPALPDNQNLYVHALSRAAMESKTEAIARVDRQLVAMIADARATLHAQHVEVDPKVLIQGFSASGMFANRFALLHPDVVAAAAVGSPGGWPIAPAPHLDQEPLPYPVGVDDIATLTGKPVDVPAARRVAFLFFLGDKDENDSVVYRDSFSAADEALVGRRFGPTPVTRWGAAERLYKAAGMNARFALYPGEAHNVSPEMSKDVEAFLASRLSTP